jgi:hypothetical protein
VAGDGRTERTGGQQVDGPARAVLDDERRPRTVGERLDDVGRRIAARHRWTSGVHERLAPPLRRAEQLAGLFAGRFERDESGGEGIEVVPRTAPGEGSAHSAPAAVDPPLPTQDGAPLPGRPAGRPLPADVRTRLRDVAGAGADVLRVHDDAGADTLARGHGADAVTIGADVYFRAGRFRPDEPAGFGVLAHETSHVTTTLETAGAGRASPGGRAAEEDVALTREWSARAEHPPVLRGTALPHTAGARPAPVVVPPGRTAGPAGPAGPAGAPPVAGGTPAAVPMTAAVDRPAAPQAPVDVEALRRDLVAEVMNRLRSDAERGA